MLIPDSEINRLKRQTKPIIWLDRVKWLVLPFIAVCLVALVLSLFAKKANAGEYSYYASSTHPVAGPADFNPSTSQWQTFTASTSYMTGFNIFLIQKYHPDATAIRVNICKADGGDFHTNQTPLLTDCGLSSLLAWQEWDLTAEATSTLLNLTSSFRDLPISTDIGATYFLQMQVYGSSAIRYWYADANTYSGGVKNGSSGLHDFLFQVEGTNTSIEETGPGSYIPEEFIDQARAEITFPPTLTCNIDSDKDCILIFDHDYGALGDVVYLIPDTQDCFPENAVASSSVIEYSPMFQGWIEIPTATTTGGVPYCLYQEDTYAGQDKSYGNFIVEWIDNEYMDMIYEQAKADYSSTTAICADLEYSWWPSGWGYGIECAGRKVTHWLFMPSKNSTALFSDTLEQVKTEFPFSLFTSVYDTISSSTIESASTTTQLLPIITAGDSLLAPLEGEYLLNPQELASSTPGFDKYYNVTTIILWIVLIIWILFRLIRSI